MLHKVHTSLLIACTPNKSSLGTVQPLHLIANSVSWTNSSFGDIYEMWR